MEPATVDAVQLNFNQTGLTVINIAIGVMMLGVALDLKLEDFKRVLVLTAAGKLGYWVSRAAPHLYEWIIERKFASELER